MDAYQRGFAKGIEEACRFIERRIGDSNRGAIGWIPEALGTLPLPPPESAEAKGEARGVAVKLKDALSYLVQIIEKAGVSNLMNGVQLGAISWSVKCNDAIRYAKAVLEEPTPAASLPMPANPLRDELLKLCERLEAPVAPKDDVLQLRSCTRIEDATELRALLEKESTGGVVEQEASGRMASKPAGAASPVLSDADTRAEELAAILMNGGDIITFGWRHAKDRAAAALRWFDARHADMVREVASLNKDATEMRQDYERMLEELRREVEFLKRQNAELARGTEALARQIAKEKPPAPESRGR